MAKLSKDQIKRHREACDLLRKDVLSEDDKWFVLNHWQESAEHINSAHGAFFTPEGLACDFGAIEVTGGHVVDLCAGIGRLAFAALQADRFDNSIQSMTCVELNADYVAVGRKIIPEATWICGDVFSVQLGVYDLAISNPPFGNVSREGAPERFLRGPFDLAVVQLASEIASRGAFILPAMSLPWSGRKVVGAAADLRRSCIDASYYADEWRGATPRVEVASADFEIKTRCKLPHPAAKRILLGGEQASLFGSEVAA